MNTKVTESEISAYRRYLARCDEFIKAYKFINAASKKYPALKEEAELAFKQVAHIYDPSLYKRFYDLTNTENPMDENTIFDDMNFPDRLRWLKRLLNNRKELTICDLGCSEGSFALNLAREGYNVTGVNLFADSIKLANERAKKFNLADKTHFVHSDVMEYDEGKKFDAVLLFEIIEHVPDPTALIDKAVSLLNKNGVCYISTPNGTADEKSSALGVDLENAAGGLFKGHVRAYTMGTLKDLLYGYEIINTYTSERDLMNLLHIAFKKRGVD